MLEPDGLPYGTRGLKISHLFDPRMLQVEVRHPTTAEGAEVPAEQPAIWKMVQPKPEIKHMFRRPDPRPPVAVSVLFAALALAPLPVSLIALARMGVNLKAPSLS